MSHWDVMYGMGNTVNSIKICLHGGSWLLNIFFKKEKIYHNCSPTICYDIDLNLTHFNKY